MGETTTARKGMFANLRFTAHLVHGIWGHPANRHQRVRAVTKFLQWQYVKRVARKPLDIDFHGRRLTCYPDSPSTSSAVYYGGFADWWEMKFLAAYLRPGDNFLDVGANTGVYSILASAYTGKDAVIDAFEPMEQAAGRLEHQARQNGLANMRVHRFAVSDNDGTQDFGYAGNDAQMHLRRPDEAATSLHVRCVRLDNFEPFANYAVGKMDIEGAEPLALAGARERLRQGNPPVWLLEFAGYTTFYGIAGHELIEQLAEAHYDCAIYDPATRRLTYTQTPWLMNVQNVLAISRRHRAFVEERLATAPAAHP